MAGTSLVEVGTCHPYPERGVTYPADHPQGSAIRPRDVRPAVQDLDTYLSAAPIARTEPHVAQVSKVRIKPSLFLFHRDWRNTAIAPAMRGETLHLPSVSADMFAALSPNERERFLDVLHCDDVKIAWRDSRGKRHSRKFNRWVRFHVGRSYRVNGAAAFAMLMAQAPTQTPTRRVLAAGLPHIITPLRGKGATIFTLDLTTRTLNHVLPRITAPASPVETRGWATAAAALVQRYLEQHTDETPISIRNASLQLLRSMHDVLPREPALLGAMVGTVFAGGLHFCAALTRRDIAKRFRRTSAVNLLWAAQNAVPLYFVAGPIAVVAVAWAIAWERLHPPRSFGAAMQHLRGEVELILENGGTPYTRDEQQDALHWLHLCEKLNGLG